MIIGHDLGYVFIVFCLFDGFYRICFLFSSFIACSFLRITIEFSRSRSIKIDCRSYFVVIYRTPANRTLPVCVRSM